MLLGPQEQQEILDCLVIAELPAQLVLLDLQAALGPVEPLEQ